MQRFMEDLQCRIIISNYQLFCFRKVKEKNPHISLPTRNMIHSIFRKIYKYHNTVIYQQTYHFFVS